MIFQTVTDSFKSQILSGEHDLLTDSLRLALYTREADLGKGTEEYTTENEVVGAGYTAGGNVVSNVTIGTLNNVVFVSFDDVVWDPASFTSAGALLYNSSKSNQSIAVFSFGGDKTATNRFRVELPPNTFNAAVLRFL